MGLWPKPDRLVADADAVLERQVLYVPKRQGYFTYIITTRRITSGDESK